MKALEFKNLIKEAVREVLLEELSQTTQTTYPQPLKEQVEISYHQSKNITPSGNPLIDLINETREDGGWKDLGNFQSENIQGFSNQFMPTKPPQTGNIGAMLNNTNKHTSDINQVNIDVVPNYSKLMSNLKEKGQI